MHNLPQRERLFVTDAGLETDLIYNHGVEIPHFASIALLQTDEGRAHLDRYFRSFIELAKRLGTGCLLESASWRGSADWTSALGLKPDELAGLNRKSVEQLTALRDEYAADGTTLLVSGCLGPRGDGYDPGRIMTPEEAEAYHSWQASALASAGPDLLSAITMTNAEEAIGIARAAEKLGLLVVISFTVETDGRLPSGQALGTAINAVDQATNGYPAYFMINCAHPSHFSSILDDGNGWTGRIGGVRANASRCSHAELNAMTELDAGDPAELAGLYASLRSRLPGINVVGGCCGTDIRHVTAIAERCVPGAA